MQTRSHIRVLFVIGQLTYGGSERHMADLALRLDAERFTPRVLCLRPGGPLGGALRAQGVVCDEVPVLSGPLPLWRVTASIRSFAPHVVCVYTYVDKLWGRLAAALAGVPVVLSAYRTVRHPWYERLLLPVTTAVAANSRALLREFNETYAYPLERLHLLPNGVDLRRFAPADRRRARESLGFDAAAPLAVMVARFAPVKGHDLAVEAFARVRERLPGALLVLVGHGPQEGRIRTLLEQAGLAGAVVFLPEHTDVPLLFAAADVVLLTSRSESLPRVLVEAAACGRPAVATDVGGCREVVADGESGYVVPAGDAAALAERLLELLCSPERATAMGLAARALAEKRFSLDAMAASFSDLCVRLLKGQGCR